MDNQWFFISWLLKIWRFIFPKNKNEKTITQTQKSGSHSKNIQAGHDINIRESDKDDQK